MVSVAKRALRSLTMYKPHKAYNGFTLFTPLSTVPSNTWLIDMQGRFVHRWQIPGWARSRADLLPNGNLLFPLVDPESRLTGLMFVAGQLVEIDWEGNIVWRYQEPRLDYHDWVRKENGNTIIEICVEIPKHIAAKVKGGIPGTELGGPTWVSILSKEDPHKGGIPGADLGDTMWGNVLQEINPEGKVVWEWVAHEHLDPELDAFTPGMWRYQWPGINSIEELRDGNIMFASPHISNIYIIDKTTGDIKWRWGKDIVSFPHNPTQLDNGNIVVFDNGRYNVRYFPPDGSRVIEVNPSTNEIEWEYKEENPTDFYSTWAGSCQRLPNGNTLICEAALGRLFEVNYKGEIVWEYIVPFYGRVEGYMLGLSNAVHRCHRYGPDYPGLQSRILDPQKLETWNRLYGPENYGLLGRPTESGMDRTSIPEDRVTIENDVSRVRHKESKPSVGKSDEEKKVSSRAKYLGY